MKRIKFSVTLAALALASLSAIGFSPADEGPPGADQKSLADQKAGLSQLQFLVGSWRGVAQPQRGSTKGSWTEQAVWAWRFDDGKAALAAELSDSQLFASFSLQASGTPGEFVLTATPTSGGEPIRYSGQLDASGKLTLAADAPSTGLPARISLRTVADGKRLLVLYEKQSAASKQLTRQAEVGYTRKGSGFGQGGSGPECVVTGGFGSIEVAHKGKTYYVCCTGCRDYFYEQPDDVLAEYRARKAEEKRKAAEGK